MKPYKMIAFDMDGTLLNSQKEVSEKTVAAMKRAMDHGFTVVLNTGRCMAELNKYFDVVDIPYVNSVSGALVLDRRQNRAVFEKGLTPELAEQVLAIAAKEDVMIHILTEKSIVQKDAIAKMDYYQMGIYRGMFEKVTDQWESLIETYLADPFPVAKINLYHPSTEAREKTRALICEAGLSVELANSEIASLEISAEGIHKGIGLQGLCDYLKIPMSRTVVVGDADNDIGALKMAGLSVAMGNASEKIKKICDVTVADNDHDGCREAIERFLFQE